MMNAYQNVVIFGENEFLEISDNLHGDKISLLNEENRNVHTKDKN